MKFVIKTILFFVALHGSCIFSEELFIRKNTKKINIGKLPFGSTFDISTYVHLPRNTKGNLMTNNYMSIYENTSGKKNGWALVKKVSLFKGSILPSVVLPINDKVSLSSESSELFFEAKVTHCKEEGGCFIDYFQKKAVRGSTSKKQVKVELFPTNEL